MRKESKSPSEISYVFSRADVEMMGTDATILRGCQRRLPDGTYARPGREDREVVDFILTFNPKRILDQTKMESVDKIVADRKIPIEP